MAWRIVLEDLKICILRLKWFFFSKHVSFKSSVLMSKIEIYVVNPVLNFLLKKIKGFSMPTIDSQLLDLKHQCMLSKQSSNFFFEKMQLLKH